MQQIRDKRQSLEHPGDDATADQAVQDNTSEAVSASGGVASADAAAGSSNVFDERPGKPIPLEKPQEREDDEDASDCSEDDEEVESEHDSVASATVYAGQRR